MDQAGDGPEARDGAALDEARRAVLEVRARRLAAMPEEATDVADDGVRVLEFTLRGGRYAVDIDLVQEVCPLEQPTEIPCTPPFVMGVINVRGALLSLVDLNRFLDLPERGLVDRNRVIVLTHGAMKAGVLVDTIGAVTRVSDAEVQEAPLGISAMCREFVLGVTADRVILLDGVRLMTDSRFIVDESVADRGGARG